MTHRFGTLLALLAAGAIGYSCAASDPVDGPGDQQGGEGGQGGAAGGDGGAATTSSSVGAGGDGGGGSADCGNQIREAGEQCDRDDLGGQTCETFGLHSGDLACNAFCKVVVSDCIPLENCTNGNDDDLDLLVDCDDDDCGMLPACIDVCNAPRLLILPTIQSASTKGRPDSQITSCSNDSGPERAYQFTASFTGDLGITLNSSMDFSISVRNNCFDPASELACADNVHNIWVRENLQLPVVQGMTYTVLIDGVEINKTGFFELTMGQVVGQEQLCANHWDDDLDGALDCDDALSCQPTSDCVPGNKATGTGCSLATECFATGTDPICLPPNWGFTGGYCSEFCDVSVNDCSGDSVCYGMGISRNGVCLDGCASSLDCRVGYDCVELGLASKVCFTPPESACNNHDDDDSDSFTDCEDPTLCKTLPACFSGFGSVGDPCSQHNHCKSYVGGDPYCMDEVQSSGAFPNGYCTEFCKLGEDDCPPGNVCGPFWPWPSGAGNCFKLCNSVNDCRPGYGCKTPPGFLQKVCVP